MVKRKPKKPNNSFALFLIIAGTCLVTYSTTHSLLRLRSLSLDQDLVESYIEQSTLVTRPKAPVHIYSQYFLDVGIEGAVYDSGNWTVSENSASYLLSSGMPGEEGNIIIYGHNKRNILGNIRAYKGGEKITLTLEDGTRRDYRVASFLLVNPTDTKLLAPTTQETLTIYTCGGILDSQRFVVTAYPLALP